MFRLFLSVFILIDFEIIDEILENTWIIQKCININTLKNNTCSISPASNIEINIQNLNVWK